MRTSEIAKRYLDYFEKHGHLEPLFSPTVAREHNTRITVVKSPDLEQAMFTGCMK